MPYCRAISIPRNNKTDRDALLQFKDKISDDPFGVFSTWNDSIHFCQWYGITCGRRHPRITHLILRSGKLVGSLSPFIGNLSFLQKLDIQDNNFVGEVPPEIGNLYRLKYLGLSNNSFSGQIPANISGCKNLEALRLGHNMLVGEVPIAIASMSKLTRVYIYQNNLSGKFPEFFGNLTSLVRISAAVNNFVGRVPASLGRLQNLEYLFLDANGLYGTLPSSLFNISSLVKFEVYLNQLEGNLPPNLGVTLPNLDSLIVGDNQFTGLIPASISNATKLTLLIIETNKFSGNVPTMEKLNQLQWISISSNQLGLELLAINDNNFGGTVPESIGNLSSQLNLIWIENNRLSGNIPSSIGNLRGLERLNMGNNEFTGSIPNTIGNLIKLKKLVVEMSKLTGNIPSTIGNLTELLILILKRSNFQGRIPPSIGKCQKLIAIDLSENSLSGIIPSQAFTISSLSIFFDLSENQLRGSLPEEIGTLKNLAALDVHGNKLSGKIPSTLGSCTSLVELHMQNNLFEGNISSFLSSLNGLQYIDLSRNNFSGPVPTFLEKFQLQYLNLSFNNFEGEIPSKGVFQNTSATSLKGNVKLCGSMPILDLPNCSTSQGKHGSSTSRYVIIAVKCGIVAVLILLLLLMMFYWLRRKKSEASLETPSIRGFQQVSYEDIVKATDGFNSSNLIGMGGFGSVYKGTLVDENKLMAVKVFDFKQREASKSFMAECEVLKNIRHRNLVKILTACSSVDFRGNEFKALVYEFMENGSLEEWLHPNLAPNGTPRHMLSFVQRLNIAFDIACAVDYLHHQCQIAVIHCDLKPSNILLDAKMNGHVGDFGLARIFPNGTGDLTASQTSSIGLRGTIGYAPPEYGMGSEVSKDGDVYSYGILLLEIFTGKRPTHDLFKDALNLCNYCAAALPERVADIVDQQLLFYETEELSIADAISSQRSMSAHVQECLVMIFEIGVACSAELPQERIKISDAVTRLRLLKERVDKMGFR
ncbi:probable LRR receptor-like serine/threonine-protein kinase At3g47570 [Eucalyptus grandis]|uniref:probable LRR receptor-like serine/threonine-protein kinase At3g47570 n=1 Tax=Eucalyptus grandis TaxID=71139 RepID=UPI00192EB6C8|nr:probable LRR receptor-like serine/threonine-protein kinase At3g47570 [Eucalyptus grandis]